MDGNTDRTGLVCNGTGDGLTDPPGGIGGKFIALGIVELFDCLDKTKIALLNQVEEEHAAADIALGNRDDQTKVCLGHPALGLFIALRHFLCQLDLLFR